MPAAGPRALSVNRTVTPVVAAEGNGEGNGNPL